MKAQSKNPFTDHPHDVGMNYFSHMLYAFTVTFRLLACFFACFIHAFFPFLFTNTTSKVVAKLHGEFEDHKKHGQS